jgi:GT2 family glycosyltransferase
VDLSLILVNWNTRDLLRQCLTSVREALAVSSLRAEVIVVDNASNDLSAVMVEAEFPEFRLVANHENRNYAAGNNQGIAAAEGTFLLLLNPDTEVPIGGLDALVAYLRENPRVGAVSPALVYRDGQVQDSVRGFPTPLAILGEMTGLARLYPEGPLGAYRPRALPMDRPTAVDQPMASAFMIRRSALEEVGTFDERFPLFFNDVDLCYRLKAAGWEIQYDPRVQVVHVGGASTRQVRPQAILASHAGLALFYALHYRDRLAWPTYAAIVIIIHGTGWLRAGLAWLRTKVF